MFTSAPCFSSTSSIGVLYECYSVYIEAKRARLSLPPVLGISATDLQHTTTVSTIASWLGSLAGCHSSAHCSYPQMFPYPLAKFYHRPRPLPSGSNLLLLLWLERGLEWSGWFELLVRVGTSALKVGRPHGGDRWRFRSRATHCINSTIDAEEFVESS